MKKFLLFFTLVFAMFLVACSEDSSSEEDAIQTTGETSEEGENSGEKSEEQILRITSRAAIPSMDTTLAADTTSFQWLGSTMEGLYRMGKDGEIKEGIAMEHEVSDDALTWTFHLREDAVWSNGEPVTAHDFVYAWQRALSTETAAEYGPYMMGGVIKNATEISLGEMPVEELGVRADGDFTLVVDLEKPVPYFESLATFGTFYPLNQKFVEEQGDEFGLEASTTLYNGPFTMTEWNHGENWTLKKNENYWDKEAVKLDGIEVTVVKEVSTAVNLYETGEIDRADLTAEYVDQYSANEAFQIIAEPSVYFLKFNQKSNEALANPDIRKALAMSFDKNALAETILNNGSFGATGFVPSDFVSHPESDKGFREINGDLLAYDVEKAKEHWKKGLKELGIDRIELGYVTDDTNSAKDVSAYIKNQMETNLEGLTINLKQVPFKERLRLEREMEYEILSHSWSPDYMDPNTYLNQFVTDGPNNNTGYSSEKYDEMLHKVNNELAQKPVERFETFLKMEKLLLTKDTVIAPIYQGATAQLQQSYVKDIYANVLQPDYSYKWAHITK